MLTIRERCLFYLSFTFVFRNIQQETDSCALSADGSLDFSKKQQYLDSLWQKPAYNFLGTEFSLQEAKAYELNLGQGVH